MKNREENGMFAELEDDQMESISGGSVEPKPKYDQNDLVTYRHSCLSCGAWNPVGRVQFAIYDHGQYAYGVVFNCCGYLYGCTEDNLF